MNKYIKYGIVILLKMIEVPIIIATILATMVGIVASLYWINTHFQNCMDIITIVVLAIFVIIIGYGAVAMLWDSNVRFVEWLFEHKRKNEVK